MAAVAELGPLEITIYESPETAFADTGDVGVASLAVLVRISGSQTRSRRRVLVARNTTRLHFFHSHDGVW